MSIREDLGRFNEIIRGKIKKNLSKYISRGEIIGRSEDKSIKIPIYEIDIPSFRYGDDNKSGVSSGDGEEINSNESLGENKVGKESGIHSFDYNIEIEQLAQILGEELSLPKIQPKGKKEIFSNSTRYNSLSNEGPKGLRNFKQTYKNSLKRMISSGEYSPDKVLVPVKNDFKYKERKVTKKQESSAVIFYLMDVSGSMVEKQKDIVRIETFWINTWIKYNYKNIKIRFIVHDSIAKEVSEDEFFSISSNGGTLISSGYNLINDILENEYSKQDANIYIFHFSDGDNFGPDDNELSVKIIKEKFLNKVNSFNYGEVSSDHGSGTFSTFLLKSINDEKVVVSYIKDKSFILKSIKTFLGKGK